MIELTDPTTEACFALWERGAMDKDWPIATEWAKYTNEMSALALLGQGELRIVTEDKDALGFVSFHFVYEEWCPAGEAVVELGTYLLPLIRGTGVHLAVKALSLQHAFSAYDSTWCVFTCPEGNHRAIRALEKLPWRFQVETSESRGAFYRLLQRRTFEIGRPAKVFALHRSAFPGPQDFTDISSPPPPQGPVYPV